MVKNAFAFQWHTKCVIITHWQLSQCLLIQIGDIKEVDAGELKYTEE